MMSRMDAAKLRYALIGVVMAYPDMASSLQPLIDYLRIYIK